ncbi:fungal specific transcription factor domain protein [Aspergillus nomiae NRRL 13137]|uniref:Fungal specific transcription factor domain protein n=1 Tax=Aspergillus nomiae NRRL (strain ATCC 15546 / NRRL 13137 / CBS 260.88 / M93) TaxID=1509407 RepID=A0A0L1INQ1_ASPN3|nr:fungal specific transcription factor domain protein [Aspergillus nomiae NRRL 13137]KNG81129.1 fungal specific transcription factor domain protein [Aspergillus nomiae NRRL 13137]
MPTVKSKCKVACKSCNLRRVKCDRTEEAPCTYCRLAGQDCQPIVSRRGKYKRNPDKSTATQPALRRSSRKQQNGRNPTIAVSGEPASDTIVINTSSPSFGGRNPTAEAQSCETSNLQSSTPPPRHGYQYSSTSPDSKVVYYGDSFNLDYILHQMGDSLGASRNGRTWEDTLEHLYFSQLGQSTKTQIEEHSRNQRLQLRDIGALRPFEKNASDDLIKVFFEMCYPQCPIFDRADFQLKYEAGRVSPLVLQAVYFVALNHCSEEVYKRAGFENRYLATFTCYQRAKTLYDTNYESDAIATLQAVYLLSFWWGSPMEQKDMWHWTGIACNRAQSLGLHQRKTYVGLSERNRKLWKRIWWTIYVHDISVTIMLGRTPHINDAYCSVEMLGEDDFETSDNELIDSDLFREPTRESRLYIIHLTDLYSRKASKCWLNIAGANFNESMILKSLDDLTSWKTSLPRELQHRESAVSVEDGLWTTLTHLNYFTVQVLIRRNGLNDPDRMKVGSIVFDAAVQIVRILEDLVSSQLLPFALMRSAPAVFAALSVQIANMRGCPSHVVDVSKHRARLCMMIINKLQDHSPPLLWYYRLFVRILRSMGCEIPDEDNRDASHHSGPSDQRLHGLHSPTADFLYNNPFENSSQAVDANYTSNDLSTGNPALCDFGLSGMTASFVFSSFLNSDLIDGTSTDLGNPNFDPSSL